MAAARVSAVRVIASVTTAASWVIGTAMFTVSRAHADPPPFPNIDSYTPVNADDYAITIDTPGIEVKATYFLTPDGILCSITLGAFAGCSGNNFPGVPPAGTPRVNAIGTGTPLHPTGDTLGTSGTVRGQKVKVLPPFHSLSLGGVVCGVDDARMTACKDPQGSGFILSPPWSGELPHV